MQFLVLIKSNHHNSHPLGPLHPPCPNHNTLFQIYPSWPTICLFGLLVPNLTKPCKSKIYIHSGVILFQIHFKKVALYTTKYQTKISQKFQKKPKKKNINKSKVMSLFYILTAHTLSLLVTLTDSFPSNSKSSLYILGLARPHLSSIFVLFSAAFKVQSMSHFSSSTVQVELWIFLL